MSDDGQRRSSSARRRAALGQREDRSHWGAADWAHLRRGQRITANRRASRRRTWAGRIGVGGAAVLVAIATAGLLGRTVRPTAGWGPQIAALLLPVLGPALGVSAAVAGVVAVRSRRVGVGLGAVALAAAAGVVWFRGATPPSATGGAEGLRVMTLNAGPSSAETSFRVTDYVGRTEPDVVFLQEVDARSVMAMGQRARILHPTVEAILGVGGYQVGGAVDTVVSQQAGPENRLVFLSRLPVVSHRAGTLGPPDTDPSVYARVEIEWQGQRVALYNVHLRAFNPSVGWSVARAVDPAVWAETPARLRSFFALQTEEAARLANLIADEEIPVIVAGDFNATPDQYARAQLAPSLAEVFATRLMTATRPDVLPWASIDGILVGAGWRVQDASVGPRGLSDHRALTAELVRDEGES